MTPAEDRQRLLMCHPGRRFGESCARAGRPRIQRVSAHCSAAPPPAVRRDASSISPTGLARSDAGTHSRRISKRIGTYQKCQGVLPFIFGGHLQSLQTDMEPRCR